MNRPFIPAILLATVLGTGTSPAEDAGALWLRQQILADHALLLASGIEADPGDHLTALEARFPSSGDPLRIDSLITALGDRDFATRLRAEVKLRGLAHSAAAALVVASKSTDPEVAIRAQRLLEELGGEGRDIALEAMFRLLKEKPDEAAFAPIIRAIPKLHAASQRFAAEALVACAPAAQSGKIAQLIDTTPAGPLRDALQRALIASDPAVGLDRFAPLLESAQGQSLFDLAHAFALAGDTRCLPALLRLMADPSTPQLQYSANGLLRSLTHHDAGFSASMGGDGKAAALDAWRDHIAERLAAGKSELHPAQEADPQLRPIRGFVIATGSGIIEFDRAGKKLRAVNFPAHDAQPLPGDRLLLTSRAPGVCVIVDALLRPRHRLSGLSGPSDAEELPNGNLLVLENTGGRIAEFDAGGSVVWQCRGVLNPCDIDRLPGGGILTADAGNGRLVEFSPEGEIRSEIKELSYPNGVARLADGSTVYTSYSKGGATLLDADGKQRWAIRFTSATLYSPATERGRIFVGDGQGGRVLVLDDTGKTIEIVELGTGYVDLGYRR